MVGGAWKGVDVEREVSEMEVVPADPRDAAPLRSIALREVASGASYILPAYQNGTLGVSDSTLRDVFRGVGGTGQNSWSRDYVLSRVHEDRGADGSARFTVEEKNEHGAWEDVDVAALVDRKASGPMDKAKIGSLYVTKDGETYILPLYPKGEFSIPVRARKILEPGATTKTTWGRETVFKQAREAGLVVMEKTTAGGVVVTK
jgi:hypothetical protein